MAPVIFNPTPPSTAEAAEGSPKPGEGISWNNSLPPRAVRDVLPSPQYSQQQAGYLSDQDMSDDYDPAYRLFYQDSNSYAGHSPPGFTFEHQSFSE
jgi:hypothetical protein